MSRAPHWREGRFPQWWRNVAEIRPALVRFLLYRVLMRKGPVRSEESVPVNLVARPVFELLLRMEAAKALRLGYSVSVACVAPGVPLDAAPDMPEATRRRALLDEVAERLAGRLRATDAAVTLPDATLALLLVDADPGALERVLERVGEVVREAALARGVDVPLPLPAGLASYPQTSGDGRGLIAEARRLLDQARGRPHGDLGAA
jgi:hypothetical protein